MRGATLLQRLPIRFEVGAEQLLQIRREWAMPRDGEDFTRGRNEFVDDLPCGTAKFMNRIGTWAGDVQAGLEMSLVALHTPSIAAQSRERGQGQRQQ